MKAFAVVVCLLTFLNVFAQQNEKPTEPTTFSISLASMYYPHYSRLGRFQKEIALSQIYLPFDWLETAAQVPLLQFHGLVGITKRISIDARLSSLVVANQISIGPRLQHEFGRFSISGGYDVGYAFGALTEFGFNSSLSNWNNYPNLSVGFRWNDIAFTLKGELNYVTSFSTSQGDNTINRNADFYNGYTIGLYIEQRLWKHHVLIVALKNSYSRYHFMAWPAFSTFNRFYDIPELYLGLMLGKNG
ncbi:MAG: hypothetical protein LW721_11275 [Flammeovirgaceae bacterium]|jgi:hypothetical protein|nr:hypothetical protein [Flammeovirgaceae bacterium]